MTTNNGPFHPEKENIGLSVQAAWMPQRDQLQKMAAASLFNKRLAVVDKSLTNPY